jgi:geranylgeranyl reductase family protein
MNFRRLSGPDPGIRYRAVIVGAGPAGSACAVSLALLGVEPVLLVDRAHFPRRKPCAGGLGPGCFDSLKSLGVWDRVISEANLITGLRGVTMSSAEFGTRGRATAWVLPRERFDAILLERARELGVHVLTGERVASILYRGGSPAGVVTSRGRAFDAIWTVVAAGGGSRLTGESRKKRMGRVLRSVIARYENIDVDPQVVEMFFDREIRPLYGWVFPEGKSTANVGLCYDWNRFPHKKPRDIFQEFTDRHLAARLMAARRAGPLAGAPIYTSFSPEHIARPGLLTVGEAGWLVNPVTGEGISQALGSGILAAGAVADHLGGKDGAGECAARYERRVKTSVCPGLILGEIFRTVGPRLLELAPVLQRCT